MAGEPAGPSFHGPAPHGSALAVELADALSGEVRADEYTRHLFATDASLYRAVPKVVVYPEDADDVQAAVCCCAEHGVPILPRGGGTSLAGQTVNEAVVLDSTRHMDAIRSVDLDAGTATVQPGLVLDRLNQHVADDGYTFGPDPAAGSRSTIGGAIGNNSAGAHSLVHGATDANLESVTVVLADGTLTTFGPTDRSTIADRAEADGRIGAIYRTIDRLLDTETDAIATAYPTLGRNVAGYNLDALLEADEAGRINLARLIAASEGTLGVIVEATVSLVETPQSIGAALLEYDDLLVAVDDVAAILEHEPAAVEVIDEHLIDRAREHPAFAERADIVSAGTAAALLIEVYDADEPTVKDRLDTIAETFGPTSGDAVDVSVTTDDETRERYWSLRKSALPLMLSETTDEKHVSIVEDAAVPPSALASFVDGFRELLAEHDTFASFYGHAGPGVLHVRPLIDVSSEAGRDRMRDIAEGAYELTIEHGGSVSGEHGDGRVRTEWTKRQYGADIVDCFEALKEAFDPDQLLNPGPITGSIDMRDSQRIDPGETVELPFEPALAWENENGLRGMVDLCHGCGGCRTDQDIGGGIMCPTYRATDEEIASTRGRANLLREAIRGGLSPSTLFDPRFEQEVLDLCIGCKGCLHDCPSSVDLATLKSELRHQRHERTGSTRRERILGDFPRLARWGSLAAPFSNWLARAPGARTLRIHLLGLTGERPPPRFASTAFTEWADGRLPSVTEGDSDQQAVIVPDPYTNYLSPETGRATVELLEAANVAVHVAGDLPPPGRAAYSQGFIDRAREQATAMVSELEPYLEDGWDIVVPEPSAAAMLQSDYAHLLGAETAAPVAAATYTPMEYLDTIDAELSVEPTQTPVTVHEHCHQQSIGRGGAIQSVLAAHGYAVKTVDSGCCGMAGSFGYQAEHYDLSTDIADILVGQLDEHGAEAVLAPGTSCRSQLEHVDGDRPTVHPAVLLADDLKE